MEQEIIDYISQAQKHGLSDVEIKQNLLNAGWEAGTVEQSFVMFKAEGSRPANDKSQITQDPRSQMERAVFPDAKPTVTVLPHQPSVAVTSQQPAPEAKPQRRSHKLAIGIVVILLFALAGGAYAYYALVLNNPAKVWQKFSAATGSPIYQTKFDFNYSDPGQLDASSSALSGFQLGNIKLALTGSGYLNNSDVTNPESNSNIQYTFSSGNTSFSTGFEYILQNKILYLNVGNNPILNMLSAAASNGQQADWIKIDTAQLQNQAAGNPGESKLYQEITSPDFKAAIEKIWENTTIIKEDKYLGRQTINGVTTLHFQNSVDKTALKSLAVQYVTRLVNAAKASGQQIADSDVVMANQIISQLIDKIQVNDFETWVGMTDFKLYQVHLVTNAPSVISFVKSAETAEMQMPESNDAKRLADVRQISNALEVYYSAHNGYPDGNNGQPAGLAPTYIGVIPQAPTPPDGTCTNYYNPYWYQPTGTPKTINGVKVYQNYFLTFCLGSDTGGYKAGVAKLSDGLIIGNIPCPTTPQQCVNANAPAPVDPTQAMKQQIAGFISKLDFSATITADVDYTDYGKTTSITLPVNPLDIMQSLNQAQGSAADAKRLADVRQLASAMELYFNDFNAYPNSLNNLVPKYIGVLPTAPPSTSAICSATDNAYTYQKISGQKYTLSFCLGASTGGYSAGKHILSQSGIQ